MDFGIGRLSGKGLHLTIDLIGFLGIIRVEPSQFARAHPQTGLVLFGQLSLRLGALVRRRGEHLAEIFVQLFRHLGQALLEDFFGGLFGLLLELILQRGGPHLGFGGLQFSRALLLHELKGRGQRRDIGKVAAGECPAIFFSGQRRDPVVLIVDALEHIEQPVVVALRNRVVLVAVAARALQGQTHD